MRKLGLVPAPERLPVQWGEIRADEAACCEGPGAMLAEARCSMCL